ncbi:MAG: hypothetical protein MUD08_01355 [Cytophagales bacterium]|jgi:hypothetical protein|nr:hypothetical protein [Cytophagales bacterium]
MTNYLFDVTCPKFFLRGLPMFVLGMALVLPACRQRTAIGCLSPGKWKLEKVYLDSMLYVNGTETQLLQRIDATEMFAEAAPVTLDFQGDVGRKIYHGTVKIEYGGKNYGVLLGVAEGGRELSECIRTMTLQEGTTLQNGQERMDTTRSGNQVSVQSDKNRDHAGTYTLRNDTLYHSYTPNVWGGGSYAAEFDAAKWKAGTLFHIRNPVGGKFANYRNGNKVFRFVWVKYKQD